MCACKCAEFFGPVLMRLVAERDEAGRQRAPDQLVRSVAARREVEQQVEAVRGRGGIWFWLRDGCARLLYGQEASLEGGAGQVVGELQAWGKEQDTELRGGGLKPAVNLGEGDGVSWHKVAPLEG